MTNLKTQLAEEAEKYAATNGCNGINGPGEPPGINEHDYNAFLAGATKALELAGSAGLDEIDSRWVQLQDENCTESVYPFDPLTVGLSSIYSDDHEEIDDRPAIRFIEAIPTLAKISTLEEQLREAREALEYYADKNNWYYLDIVNDRKAARIDDSDWSNSVWTPQTKNDYQHGGERARAALLKLSGKA